MSIEEKIESVFDDFQSKIIDYMENGSDESAEVLLNDSNKYAKIVLSLIQIEVDCSDYVNNLCLSLNKKECPNLKNIANYVDKCKTKGKITKPAESGDEGKII